jgi:hypothetical protein
MRLTLLVEQLEDVVAELSRPRQRDLPRGGCVWARLSHDEARTGLVGNEPRDGLVAIEHADVVASTYPSQHLAESRLELGDANVHDHIMT